MSQVIAVQEQMQNEIQNAKDNELYQLNEQIGQLDNKIEEITINNSKFFNKLPLLIKKFPLWFKLNYYYSFKPWLKILVYDYLSDDTMILLAIGMVPAIVLPYFFDFKPMILTIFEWVNYIVLLLFLVEFVLKLYVANSWKEFFIGDKWHFFDLFILGIAGLEFLPIASIYGTTASPLLRLFRLVRAVAVTGRTVGRKGKKYTLKTEGETKACILDSSLSARCITLKDFDERVMDAQQEWIDIQNVNMTYIKNISNIINVPEQELINKVINEASPGIEYSDDYIMIFLKDLKLEKFNEEVVRIKISHNNLAIVFAESSIITLSLAKNNLYEQIALNLSDKNKIVNKNFTLQILYYILEAKVKDYREIVNLISHETEGIEIESEQNPGKSGEGYLKDTYLLKKEINNVYYGLKRMEHVINKIINKNGRDLLKEMTPADIEKFKELLQESENVKGNAEDIRTGLNSLVEMHMSTISYDMNKVMKVLTLITCLTVIPTVITGFFGENILGSTDPPFGITLFEVFTLVVYMMAWGGLYAYIKGWLN